MDSADSNGENLIPEVDRDFLREKEYAFEVFKENGATNVIIKNFSFPAQFYSPSTADFLISMPAGYPNAILDMFFTKPDVKLLSGSWPQNSDQPATFRNETWQRWSRHFDSQNPWRAGFDNLRTFLTVMKKEIEKGI